MGTQGVVYLNGRAAATKPASLTGLFKRLGSSRFPRVLFQPRPVTEDDPHLLVLLASQALDEGREEQAICLIDAAYDAFDLWANITLLRHVSHGPSIDPRNTESRLSTI